MTSDKQQLDNPARAAFFAVAQRCGLFDATDILYALRAKQGDNKILTTLSRNHGIAASTLSQNLKGVRTQEYVLQVFADYVGFPVRGVAPKDTAEA